MAADRVDRKRLMVSCDVASAVVVASVPLAGALGRLTLAHIFVVAFTVPAIFVWFDAANWVRSRRWRARPGW